MTDQMSPATRPTGPVPVWASNAVMTDGTNPWNNTPTKVRPAAGLIAEGYHPTEQPPPERMNWKENDQDRRLALMDMLEARNWIDPPSGLGWDTDGVSGTVGDFAFATWAQVPTIYHATDDRFVRKSTDGGYGWVSDFGSAAGAHITAIATRHDAFMTGATAVSYAVGGVAKVGLTGGGSGFVNAWASTTLTGTGVNNQANVVIGDSTVGSVFFVGGADSVTGVLHPVVWRVVDGTGAFASQTAIPMGPSINIAVRIIACSPTFKVAAGQSTTNVTVIWRWQDGDASAVVVTSPTTDEIRDILWMPEDGLFLLIATNGSNTTMWTSADGSTGSWSLLSLNANGTNAFQTGVPFIKGAAVRGSIIMVPITYGGATYIMLSGDLGATWEMQSDPMARHNNGIFGARVRNVGPRFICAGLQSAGVVAHAYTLRAG